MKFNSEDAIDDWFEDEKKAIHEKFAETQMKNPAKSKEIFDKAMSKVLLNYEKYHRDMWAREHRNQKMQKPVKDVSASFSKRKNQLKSRTKRMYKESRAEIVHLLEESEKKKIAWHLKLLRWLHRYK